jgi:hypothetical protein
MQIDQAEQAIIVILQPHPIAHRAEIIAEMEIAGGLDARKNPLHETLWKTARLRYRKAGERSTGIASDHAP